MEEEGGDDTFDGMNVEMKKQVLKTKKEDLYKELIKDIIDPIKEKISYFCAAVIVLICIVSSIILYILVNFFILGFITYNFIKLTCPLLDKCENYVFKNVSDYFSSVMAYGFVSMMFEIVFFGILWLLYDFFKTEIHKFFDVITDFHPP